jgi:class 3 adenylate cyclase
VVAGVIGKHKFSYDLWGDAVNVASRMESHGLPGRIHLAESTYCLLKHAHSFESRGAIEIKGQGAMNTYLYSDIRVIG